MPDNDVPDYRLYTSAEAAKRAGNGLKASLFDGLARSGKVVHTRIGRKIRWTDLQIAAVVAFHAVQPACEEAKAPPSASHTRTSPSLRHGTVTELVSKPGRRYADAQ